MYQVGLEQSMKDREFAFDYIDGLHYKCLKVSLSSGGFYIDYAQWLKNQKATINAPKNCHTKPGKVGKNPETALKISPIKINMNKKK